MRQKSPDETQHFSENLGEQIADLLKDPEAIKKAAANAADGAAEYIRKHPYQTLGAALAVGFLAGLYLGKKKQS